MKRGALIFALFGAACTTRELTGVDFGVTEPAIAFWVTLDADDRPVRASAAFDPRGKSAELVLDDGETGVAAIVLRVAELTIAEPRVIDGEVLSARLLLEPDDNRPQFDRPSQIFRMPVPETRALYRIEGRGAAAKRVEVATFEALASAELLVKIDPDPCKEPARELVPYLADPDEIDRWGIDHGGENGSIGALAIVDETSVLVATVPGVLLVRRGGGIGSRVLTETQVGDVLPLASPLGGYRFNGTTFLRDPVPLSDGRTRVYFAGGGFLGNKVHPLIHEIHVSSAGMEYVRTATAPNWNQLVSAVFDPEGQVVGVNHDGYMFRWDGGTFFDRAYGGFENTASYDWRVVFTADEEEPILVADQNHFGYVDRGGHFVVGASSIQIGDMTHFGGDLVAVGRNGVFSVRRNRAWTPYEVFFPESFLGCAVGSFPHLAFSRTLRKIALGEDGAYIVAQECTAILRMRPPAENRKAACISPIQPASGTAFSVHDLSLVDEKDGIVVTGGDHGILLGSFPR